MKPGAVLTIVAPGVGLLRYWRHTRYGSSTARIAKRSDKPIYRSVEAPRFPDRGYRSSGALCRDVLCNVLRPLEHELSAWPLRMPGAAIDYEPQTGIQRLYRLSYAPEWTSGCKRTGRSRENRFTASADFSPEA